MGVNKVIYGEDTLIDLTNDTVTSENLLNGVTAHAADGSTITGSVVTHDVIDNLTSESIEDALSANQGRVLNNIIDNLTKELTQAEYNALSEEEKNNGTTYYITDGVSSKNKAINVITNDGSNVQTKLNILEAGLFAKDVIAGFGTTNQVSLQTLNSNLTNITNNLSGANIKFGYGQSITFVTKKSRAFLVLAIENASNNVFVGRTKVASDQYFVHKQIHGAESFSFTDNGNGTCTVAYTGTQEMAFGWLVIS